MPGPAATSLLTLPLLLLIIFSSVIECSVPWFTEQPTNVTAHEGSEVVLRCAASGDPPPDIVWYRNNVKLKFPNDWLSVQNTDSQSVLRIPYVSQDKKQTYGVFRCGAHNPDGDTASRSAHVNLYYLGSEFGERLVDQAVPRGRPARIECHQPEGNPTPTVKWLKNLQPIEPSSEMKVLSDGSLLISAVLDSHAGFYTCVASNSVGERSNGPAHISVGEYPDIQLQPDSGFNIRKGGSLTVTCMASGDPAPFVWWVKSSGGEALTDQNQKSIASLALSQVTAAENGQYSCNAKNSVGKESRQIEVIVSEPPYFLEKPESMIAAVNSSVELKCRIGGNPRVSVYWDLVDASVLHPTQSMGNKMMQSDATLRIRNFQPADAGVYRCNGVNTEGTVAANATLTLKEIPRFPPIIQQCPLNSNFSTSPMPLTTLECGVGNNQDGKLSFKWFLNDQPVETDEVNIFLTQEINEERGSRLSIYKWKKSVHEGEYTCRVQNKNGYSECSSRLLYTTADPKPEVPDRSDLPERPTTPLGRVIDRNSIMLDWHRPINVHQDDHVTYRVEYFHVGAEGWIVARDDVPTTSTTITDLKSETEYFFVVRARNSAGLGKASLISDAIFLSESVVALSGENCLTIMTARVEIQEPIVLNSTALRIAWDVTHNLQVIHGFSIQYREKGSALQPSHAIVHTSTDRHYILRNLRPYTHYEISIQAFCNGGGPNKPSSVKGDRTRIVTARTLPDTPSEAPQDIHALLNSSALIVSWRPPPKQYWNSEYLLGYHIWVFSDKMSLLKNHTVNNETFTVTYQLLPNLDGIRLQIAAVNEVEGFGLRSSIVNVHLGLGDDEVWWKHPWFLGVVGAIFWVVLLLIAICLYRLFKRRHQHSHYEKPVEMDNTHRFPTISRGGGDPVGHHWGSRPCSQCGGQLSSLQNCPDLIRQGKAREYQTRAAAMHPHQSPQQPQQAVQYMAESAAADHPVHVSPSAPGYISHQTLPNPTALQEWSPSPPVATGTGIRTTTKLGSHYYAEIPASGSISPAGSTANSRGSGSIGKFSSPSQGRIRTSSATRGSPGAPYNPAAAADTVAAERVPFLQQQQLIARQGDPASAAASEPDELSYAVIGGVLSSDAESSDEMEVLEGESSGFVAGAAPKGEPSDIDSMYNSTMPPSSVYSLEELSHPYQLADPYLKSPGTAYETAYPNDSFLSDNMYPQYSTARAGHHNYPAPVNSSSGYMSESDAMTNRNKGSKRNIKLEDNSFFTPIVTPRPSKQCVPNKLIRPQVNPSSGGQPSIPESESEAQQPRTCTCQNTEGHGMPTTEELPKRWSACTEDEIEFLNSQGVPIDKLRALDASQLSDLKNYYENAQAINASNSKQS
uniref:Robo1 protein n=1 Tax=Isodiametra pulchra TaxID=504439 RepID=A0A2P1DV78_ISOPU|nr:Robo1 protein [Isodiametra pulchra]